MEKEDTDNIYNHSLSALNWMLGASNGDLADVEDAGGEMNGGGGETHIDSTSHTR